MTDELFEVPPEQFTAARNALVKALRKDGRKDEAVQVAAMRRPTAVVWAVNQLARRHPADVERLLDASANLERAQRKAMSGSAVEQFRKASAERNEAVSRLVELASSVLESPTSSVLDRIRSTLIAAASGDGRALLRTGRLTDEGAPTGFESLSPLRVVPDVPGDKANEDDEAEAAREEERREALALAERLRGRADEARKRVEQLEREASAASDRAERLRVSADNAAAAAARATEELERAREDAATARIVADDARNRVPPAP